MDSIFRILNTAQQASQYALDAAGRYNAPIRAIITNNQDPEKRRRIRVSDPACPGLETYWVRPVRSESYVDCVLPDIGATVICWFVDGNPIDGYYLPVQNDTNPPFDKADPIKDRWQNVPSISRSDVGKDRIDNTSNNHTEKIGNDASRDVKRDVTETIARDYTQTTGKSVTIAAGTNVLIEAGANITLAAGATLTLTAGGVTWVINGGGTGGIQMSMAGNSTWDFAGHTLTLQNVGDFKIGSKSIAVVGAPDTDGDLLTSRGY